MRRWSGWRDAGAKRNEGLAREAGYRIGRLGKRCGMCEHFRDMDMAVHEGTADAYEGATRQGRDEFDEAHDPSEPPPSCTLVVSPIRPRGLCNYFEKR